MIIRFTNKNIKLNLNLLDQNKDNKLLRYFKIINNILFVIILKFNYIFYILQTKIKENIPLNDMKTSNLII